MNIELMITLITGFFTLMGSTLGVLASQKLSTYRIQKLEEVVSRHSAILERTLALEERTSEILREIRDIKGGKA